MSKRQLPEVRIKNAWLLREAASVHLHKIFAKDDEIMTSHVEIDEIIKTYENAWEPVENKILNGMCDIMNLEFYQNTLDVYVAPWFYPFSDPLVMGIMFKPDRFVAVLTHEILHRLLTDNTAMNKNTDLLAAWHQMFGSGHSNTTLVHIPVHAVHKAIIYDVLKDPGIKDADYNKCLEREGKDGDYVKAWDYVDKHGYKEIIKKLKTIYK